MSESFPRQSARTRGFSLGAPRTFTVADDGSRVAFLRTPTGDDPVASLWVYDVERDEESVVFDPKASGGAEATAEHTTPEERDRRERAGERQIGVVAYATDPAARIASFAVGERLYAADLVNGSVQELAPGGPAFDPRPDPTGRRIAYVTHGTLRMLTLDPTTDALLASDDDPDVRWGVAEFIAAEEMGRMRGYWWAPDGERVIAARVDEAEVPIWHIASPSDPSVPPRAVHYPRAGGANASVTLHVLGLDGSRVDVDWDRLAFEYVVAVSWSSEGPPIALVQSRDQRTMQVLGIDPGTGATQVLLEDRDERWTHITPGVPSWLPGGRLLTTGHRDDTRRLQIDGEPVTPAGLQVDSVLHVDDAVVFRATEEPTEMHVWRLAADGALTRISEEPGLHAAAVGGDVMVLVSDTTLSPLSESSVLRAGEVVHTILSFAEAPMLTPKPMFFEAGPKRLRSVLLTPGGGEPEAALPVLMCPYGGPHSSRVVRAGRAHLESQWFADQGFVVLVSDGRGTPSRGVAWEQSVFLDLATPALEDQVEALRAAAESYPFLDLSKVAIRGWSFGGYLTCLALLRRPDVFHAGIAGAPVTDWHLYDTHYTERYLGMPSRDAHADADARGTEDAYDRASIIADASNLRGELLMIHGFADDNVHVAHSLLLSKAMTEAGRRHSMIPLSGIAHRPSDPTTAENMLKIEVDFLRRALDVAPRSP
ncbi:MAG: prolyl oligopeptidase family serine peptidase [Actinomycetota bacterium]|nr:prolyl oligopeptidase family serine peptidase [Actinomycetota bacterium]